MDAIHGYGFQYQGSSEKYVVALISIRLTFSGPRGTFVLSKALLPCFMRPDFIFSPLERCPSVPVDIIYHNATFDLQLPTYRELDESFARNTNMVQPWRSPNINSGKLPSSTEPENHLRAQSRFGSICSFREGLESGGIKNVLHRFLREVIAELQGEYRTALWRQDVQDVSQQYIHAIGGFGGCSSFMGLQRHLYQR